MRTSVTGFGLVRPFCAPALQTVEPRSPGCAALVTEEAKQARNMQGRYPEVRVMTRRAAYLISLVAAGIMAVASAPSLNAETIDKLTFLTFSGTVQIPGTSLGA